MWISAQETDRITSPEVTTTKLVKFISLGEILVAVTCDGNELVKGRP